MTFGQRHSPSGGHILLIAAFAVVVGLSGLLTVPPLDRDESRFIQATTQMIETGDYVRINFQETERNKKPVGIYWLQAASVQAFADIEDRPLWAFRLPSLIGATLAAIFTYVAGCALFGRRAGFLAGVLIAAAPVVAGEASIAKTDATLLACVCGMQAALAWIFTAPAGAKVSLRTQIAFWAAIGAGILIKGPIAPMIGAFTVIGMWLWRRQTGAETQLLRRLNVPLGLMIVLAIVLPWLVAIGIVTDGRFFAEAVGKDMLGKVTSEQERHGGPIGYHFIALWVMFWPAALFIPAAFRHQVPRWREGAVAFCLAWVVPSWAIFELTSTKLPHYPMVLYPGIALLIGALLNTGAERSYPIFRWAGAIVYTIVGIAAAVGVVYLARIYSSDGINAWHFAGASVVIGATLAAGYLWLRSKGVSALTMATLASGVLAWGAFEGVLPTLDRLALTPRLAQMLDDYEAHPLRDDKGAVALVGYHEPSAVFVLGTDTKLFTAREAAVWIVAGEGRAVVIEARAIDEFLAALPGRVQAQAIASIEGFNYSNSTDMRLVLYRLE